MNWFDHARPILPALLAAGLTAVATGCDSGAAPTAAARGTLKLEPSTSAIAPGESFLIPFQVRGHNGETDPTARPIWSSSDSRVAIVSPEGLVSGLESGSAVIRASYESSADSFSLTVRPIRYRQVVAGEGWTCGLTVDGATYCWGYIFPLRIPDRGLPVRIHPELRLVRLALEIDELCGIDEAGGLYCTTSHPVSGLARLPDGPYREVATGLAICAVKATGATVCGGSNAHGNAGTGRIGGEVPFPSEVMVTPLVSVSSGAYRAHTCGITAEGEAWCWGWNDSGELGDGTRAHSAVPVRVRTTLRFWSVYAGVDYTCGVSLSYELWCWGRSPGSRAAADSVNLSPVRMPLPNPVVDVDSAGVFNPVCALAGEGVWCWGGFDGLPPRRLPGFPPLNDLSVGAGHVCGTTSGGEAWCSGSNYNGQLGNGTLRRSEVAIRVADRSR